MLAWLAAHVPLIESRSHASSINPTGRVAEASAARRRGWRCSNYIVIGFQWAGWTLDSTAVKQVKDAEQASVVRVLAPICADKFQRSADATINLDALNKADSWTRNEIVEKAGWTKFPGSEPERAVAEACVKLLSPAK
jgi:hypothetical protein